MIGAKKDDKCFRCNLYAMIKLEGEIHKYITSEHIQVLMRTPFGNFFNFFYERKINKKEVTKSAKDIISIMSKYSQDKDAFKLGTKWVELTVDDVVLTFGMPKKGKKVNLLRGIAKQDIESDFIQRQFSEVEHLNKKAIVNAIKKTVILKGRTHQEDFCRLVILFMAVTIFFPNSPGSISWSFIQNIEDFNTMNQISWPSVVHENLMIQVRKQHKNPVYVSGCVIQLMYWLCEHVDIISPFERSESHFPRIARWSLQDLSKTLATQSLEDLPNEKVSIELKNISACERMLLDVDAEKKTKIEIENGTEMNENIWEKNKRLKIENIRLRKRVKYLEKKVIRLQSDQDDSNSIDDDDETEEENLGTEVEKSYSGEQVKQSSKETKSGNSGEEEKSDTKEMESVQLDEQKKEMELGHSYGEKQTQNMEHEEETKLEEVDIIWSLNPPGQVGRS